MEGWLNLVAATAGPKRRRELTAHAPVPPPYWRVQLSRAQRRERRALGRHPRTTYEDWRRMRTWHKAEYERDGLVVSRTDRQTTNALECYAEKCERLLKKYGAGGWSVVVSDERDCGAFAYVNRGSGQLVLLKHELGARSDRDVFNIVMHEIAHVLDRREVTTAVDERGEVVDTSHDDVWRRLCVDIGGTGEPSGDMFEETHGYVWERDLRCGVALRCCHRGRPCVAVVPRSALPDLVRRGAGRSGALVLGQTCRLHGSPFAAVVVPPGFAGDESAYVAHLMGERRALLDSVREGMRAAGSFSVACARGCEAEMDARDEAAGYAFDWDRGEIETHETCEAHGLPLCVPVVPAGFAGDARDYVEGVCRAHLDLKRERELLRQKFADRGVTEFHVRGREAPVPLTAAGLLLDDRRGLAVVDGAEAEVLVPDWFGGGAGEFVAQLYYRRRELLGESDVL